MRRHKLRSLSMRRFVHRVFDENPKPVDNTCATQIHGRAILFTLPHAGSLSLLDPAWCSGRASTSLRRRASLLPTTVTLAIVMSLFLAAPRHRQAPVLASKLMHRCRFGFLCPRAVCGGRVHICDINVCIPGIIVDFVV